MGAIDLRGEGETIRYAHTAAVTAWTPIRTSRGILIPRESADANVETVYMSGGQFYGNIAAGITISQFDPLYWVTATSTLTNVDPGSTLGFLIGIADAAGTAVAGYVLFSVFSYPLSAQVSLEHLDSGISPGRVIKRGGRFNATGTSVVETVTDANLTSLDDIFAIIRVAGVDTSAYVKKATAADGSATITLSTPTGAGASISWNAQRAAS